MCASRFATPQRSFPRWRNENALGLTRSQHILLRTAQLFPTPGTLLQQEGY
jgi:hypothetical protein